ncbi:MAG TPA: amidohydrolase family protein [Gemmatimonadales bacterium]|jgi:imidazolonepropionase-like amidohydrolase|nr:amidohydrolase family protein [Gemmatimonadales bacterium]
MARFSTVTLTTATIGLFTVACGGSAPKVPEPAPVAPSIAIVGATLWDGTGRAPVPNAVTLVRRDRILCAGAAGECTIPAGARIIDAQGQYLIPGLIDSHVHLLFLIRGSAGEQLGLDLRDLLAQGITTVRDMGTDPAGLLSRVRAVQAAPRVHAMQLVAGRRFFFNGFHGVATARGTIFRQPPAIAMQQLGWKPLQYDPGADADAIVAQARQAGAMGLKLYAQLDSGSVRALTEAAHRAGMPVWGHAWVQPASVMEQVRAGQNGVVHSAGLAGELFTVEDRDTLVRDGDLQAATASVATVGAALDPRVLAALDSMARRGTILEPTLDAVRHSVASYDAKLRHIPSLQEEYVRSASRFGMEVARQAVRRGVRISAGSDHVSYGPAADRATLFGELRLLVDSVGLSPTAALLAATRDAARAIGGQPGRQVGTIQKGRYADLVLLAKNPLEDIANLEFVELVMVGGKVWRPGQLRSGIAMR